MFATFFVLLTIVGLWPDETNAVRSMSNNNNMEERAIPLFSLLANIGRIHNCYFTVESAWRDDEPINVMEPHLINLPQDKTTLHSTLEYLRQTVPNFTYMINPSNNRIIHVIDARLLKQEGYGLTRVLKSVSFSGSISDLLDFIGRQGIPVGKVGLIDTRDMMVQDSDTTVKAKGQNLQVRYLLSNYIPLEGRGRIIWIARTKLGKGEISRVQFRKGKEQP